MTNLPSPSRGLPILATKLIIPTVRNRWVKRAHLLEQLTAWPHAGLVLICAPAGYGKTSLLAEWCRHLGQQTPIPAVAWLSLDESDSDPLHFWSGVAAALRSLPAYQHAGEALVEHLRPTEPTIPPIEKVLRQFLNDLVGKNERLILILDDYHMVINSTIHQNIIYILNHLPPNLCLVLSSRNDPSLPGLPDLPIPRLRASGLVLELNASDLRFTLEEVHNFLKIVMGIDLDAQQVKFLEQQTEGWAAGLQLAALSLQGSQGVQSVQHFSGNDRYILDYLTQEVLDQQPPETRDFLLKTAILTRLCAPLCDALVGRGSQAMLERLEAANLFIVSLDRQRRWYRYHHLFSELLYSRLSNQMPEQVRELHRCAANWYWTNGYNNEAIEHAIKVDFHLAARWIEDSYIDMTLQLETNTLQRWLQAMPPAFVSNHPGLCVIQAWIDLILLRYDSCETWLQRLEQALAQWTGRNGETQSQAYQSLRGQAAAIRSTLAISSNDHTLALEFARQALEQLPPQLDRLRALIQLDIGDALQSTDPQTAVAALRQAVEISKGWDHPGFLVICAGSLVNALIILGQFRAAEREFRAASEAEQTWVSRGHEPLDVNGKLLVIFSVVLYEKDDLLTARKFAIEGIRRCERWGHIQHQVDGWLALARIAHALENQEETEHALLRARTIIQEYPGSEDSDHNLSWDKKLHAKQEKLSFTEVFIAIRQNKQAWLKEWVMERDLESVHPNASETDQMLYIRYLIQQDRVQNSKAVLHIIPPLILSAQKQGLKWRLAVLHSLAACAHHAAGQIDESLTHIRLAVEIGADEGYQRVFLDIGQPIVEVLTLHLKTGTATPIVYEYVNSLLRRLVPGPSQQKNPDTLTSRELDVLRYLAEGMPNAEIARKLYITPNTVKTHIKHIYEKLRASNRVELIGIARKSGLI